MLATMTMGQTYIENKLVELGWTIDKFAREIGMSYSQTHDIVKKGFKPGTRLGTIEEIAGILGVPVAELISMQRRKD